MRNLLLNSCPRGKVACSIYEEFAHRLQQPYLLRISLAATTPQILLQAGHRFLDEEFQIVHVAGHGPAHGLALEDETGRASIVPQQALADLFKAYSPPYQVCHS